MHLSPGLARATAFLRSLGGVVEARNSGVDYPKVSVPIGRAEDAVKAAGVRARDVDGLIPIEDPRPDGTIAPIPQRLNLRLRGLRARPARHRDHPGQLPLPQAARMKLLACVVAGRSIDEVRWAFRLDDG